MSSSDEQVEKYLVDRLLPAIQDSQAETVRLALELSQKRSSAAQASALSLVDYKEFTRSYAHLLRQVEELTANEAASRLRESIAADLVIQTLTNIQTLVKAKSRLSQIDPAVIGASIACVRTAGIMEASVRVVINDFGEDGAQRLLWMQDAIIQNSPLEAPVVAALETLTDDELLGDRAKYLDLIDNWTSIKDSKSIDGEWWARRNNEIIRGGNAIEVEMKRRNLDS